MADGIINQGINKFSSGLNKEFLDMTYPDEYYKNTIQPAKAGTGPVPSKMQMASKAQPFKAMMIGMDPYLPGFMQQGYDKFRAAPTSAANNFLKGVGNVAKFGMNRVAPLAGIFASTPANADETNMTIEDFQNLQNNTFTSSVANSPYEMDYMPPDRYRNFEQRVGTPQTTEEEKLSLFQRGKDLASSGIGKAGKLGMDAFNMLKNNNPLSFISSLANTRNPLNPGSSNYDSNLQDQIDSLKGQTGTRITGTSDNLKFTDGLSMINDNKYGLGSVLAGKNVTSGFGTNNYEVSLQNFIDKMMGYKTRSKFQQAKLDRAKRELAAEQSRQQSALEAQLAAAARESARMGYQDYGSGAASQSTQDSYQGADGNYAGASTQDYDTPD